MNRELNKAIIATTICFSSFLCFAQNKGTGIANEEVVVVKEYEATIQDAQKINLQPGIPDVEETKPNLDYTIPQNEFKEIAFEANPLRPLAISKEKLEKDNTSFIKIGFGSQIMPIVQMAYNDNKTKNLQFGLYYDHLSAKGYTIKNQQFSDDLAGIYLKYFLKKFEIGADFSFHNYRTHFYGTDSSYDEKAVRQVFRTYDGKVYFKNAQPNKAGIDVKQTLNFNYLQETYGGAYEWFAAGQTELQKSFLKYHAVLFDFNFDVSQLQNSLFTLNRNLITPRLGYSFNNDDWKAHAKIGLTDDNGRVVFACDLHVEKRLYEHALIAYLSFTNGVQKNSLASFAQINNFIQDNILIQNSTVADFAAGFKGTIQNFSYNIAFNLNRINNLPFFINDSADLKRFIVIYDNNSWVYNTHLEAGYNAKNWLRFLVIADYNAYQLHALAQPWSEPGFRGTFRATYVWKNKISASLDFYGVSNANAILPDGIIQKLKGTGDINLSAEYIFSKHLSFFAMLNNIANLKYERWYNYQSFGINGAIGGKFSF